MIAYLHGEAIMSRNNLEERVAALEQQVGALIAQQGPRARVKDWRRTRGAFTGDEVMKQIFDAGRKIREAERKRARTRKAKKQPGRK